MSTDLTVSPIRSSVSFKDYLLTLDEPSIYTVFPWPCPTPFLQLHCRRIQVDFEALTDALVIVPMQSLVLATPTALVWTPRFENISSGITVEVMTGFRSSPELKLSSWVNDRSVFEAQMRDGVVEVILSTKSGEVLEGLTSNVFIVSNGKVQTAPRKVLQGTVREIVMEIIQVDLVYPLVSEIHTWTEVFICNAGKGIVSVSSVWIGDQEHFTPKTNIADALRIQVSSLMHRI